MSRFLDDIQAQPEALELVLADLAGPKRAVIERAAALIATAERVVITSMGSALFSTMPMHHVLRAVHPNVHLVETADLLRDAPFSERTLYVIASRSGESGEIAAFARQVRARGGTLLAITMTPDSTLARHADLVLHDIASYDGLICTKAFTSLMLCGLWIAFQVRGQVNDTLIARLGRHICRLEGEAERILALLRDSVPLREATVPYFLSRDAGACIAHAGALYMHEGALMPVVVDSIGMFHHGPMERADEGFAALWIDLDPDAYSLGLYRRIEQQGAALVPVSVEDGAYRQGFLFGWEDVPVAFRCLPAALVVQLYAWWLADSHGHEAGEMRHLQWLIT